MNIAWCQATGIYAKIMEDVVYISKTLLTISDIHRLPKIKTGESLSVTHLIPPFILLAIGLLLSAVTFCVEKGRQKALRAKNGSSHQDRWGFPQGQVTEAQAVMEDRVADALTELEAKLADKKGIKAEVSQAPMQEERQIKRHDLQI